MRNIPKLKKLSIIKITIFPRLIYEFKITPIKKHIKGRFIKWF